MLIPDAASFAAWGAGIGTFLSTMAGGMSVVVRSIRKRATENATTKHEETQKKIDKAVEVERKRQADVISVLQNACDAYKDLAGVRQAQKDDLQVQFDKLSKDFEKIKKENLALRQANTDMIVQMQELKGRLETLESLAKALPHQ